MNINDDQEVCIYCDGRHRNSAKFTEEHIWPRSLGGLYCRPDIFVSNVVCKDCNDMAGQWVDAGFSKNWIVGVEHTLSANRFGDPDKTDALPLTFMGFDENFPVQSHEVCERWTGPAGEHVYYIHEKDSEKWFGYAGGDLLKRKNSDHGRVYFLLTSRSEYWFLVALKSIKAEFPRAKIRSLTKVTFGGKTIDMVADDTNLTDSEKVEIEWIYNKPLRSESNTNLEMRIDFADRFLAKLALGLGRNMLGPLVSRSDYADELRKLLWSKSPIGRENIKVRGSSYWENYFPEGFANIVGWKGAWTVALQRIGNDCALMVVMPSGKIMTMCISNDPYIWRSQYLHQIENGVAFITIPQRKISLGPIELPEISFHRDGLMKNFSLHLMEVFQADSERLPEKQNGIVLENGAN